MAYILLSHLCLIVGHRWLLRSQLPGLFPKAGSKVYTDYVLLDGLRCSEFDAVAFQLVSKCLKLFQSSSDLSWLS
jgi:hypothetical protein